MNLPPLAKLPLDLTAPGLMQSRKYEPLENFLKLHTPVVTADANGNGDDVFKATNVAQDERTNERHGYENGDDKAVYNYHNEDLLDALHKANQAVRGKWFQTWNQQHNDPGGADPADDENPADDEDPADGAGNP